MGERKRDKVKRNCRKKGVKYEKQQNEEKGEKSVRIRGRKELKQEKSMRKEKMEIRNGIETQKGKMLGEEDS